MSSTFTVNQIGIGEAKNSIKESVALPSRLNCKSPKTFSNTLLSVREKQVSQPQIMSGFLQVVTEYGQNWQKAESSIQKLEKNLPPSFSAMFELQRTSQQLQMQTHIVAAGCDSISQSIKKLQQTG